MAKMKLSESTFTLIPEGITTFKVMEVDDSKYEDFGKISVKLQTAKGETHTENFTLQTQKGEVNEGALKAWSYFARTCLNNFQADEIDTQDIVGCYITATVKHETYIRTKVAQGLKRSPARGGARQDLFWNTVHNIKKFDKTRISIKLLNTFIR